MHRSSAGRCRRCPPPLPRPRATHPLSSPRPLRHSDAARALLDRCGVLNVPAAASRVRGVKSMDPPSLPGAYPGVPLSPGLLIESRHVLERDVVEVRLRCLPPKVVEVRDHASTCPLATLAALGWAKGLCHPGLLARPDAARCNTHIGSTASCAHPCVDDVAQVVVNEPRGVLPGHVCRSLALRPGDRLAYLPDLSAPS